METGVTFRTGSGIFVPAVTADQMREVDRIAVDEFGLGILQMMENAGRNLALNVLDMLVTEAAAGSVSGGAASPELRATRAGRRRRRGEVVVLAGSGGNGGGGLCCARHLYNHGFTVHLFLSKGVDELDGAAAHQLGTLCSAGLRPAPSSQAGQLLHRSCLAVDALIGYSLRGAPRGRVGELIDLCNQHAERVLSLDLPSGLDATTGETPGVVVRPERTMTLALPKTGLRDVAGDLYLADIGIPPEVYRTLGLSFEWPSADRYSIRLET